MLKVKVSYIHKMEEEDGGNFRDEVEDIQKFLERGQKRVTH